MKKIPIGVVALLALCVSLSSCNSYSNSTTNPSTGSNGTSKPSGLAVRAFVSNPLLPSGTAGVFANVLNIMDASKDELAPAVVNLSGAGTDAGIMALSPNKQLLLVFGPAQNSIAVVNTQTEAVVNSASGLTVSTITLPGPTESMLIGGDNATGYAAVPTAPVSTSPIAGAVEVMNLSAVALTASIPVPGARYLVSNHSGNRLLAFGDGSNTVTVITPSSIGTATDPRTPVCCFDHPVWGAVSSDDSKAYILNCGPECGGAAAGLTILNLNDNTLGATLPLGSGATVGFINGTTLYVAGSPPGQVCPTGTAAATCGTLQIVNLNSMTVTNSTPILIADGYHRRMDLSNNGQLFIGSTTCSNVTSSAETRGCLSIYNTTNSKVVIPPDNGDVTGLQAIAGRSVVYVCEGGLFRVYDATTDKLQVPPAGTNSIVIVGDPIDVKLVD